MGGNDSLVLAQCDRITPRNQESFMTVFQSVMAEHEANSPLEIKKQQGFPNTLFFQFSGRKATQIGADVSLSEKTLVPSFGYYNSLFAIKYFDSTTIIAEETN